MYTTKRPNMTQPPHKSAVIIAIVASLLLGGGVLLGAFGAHALQRFADAKALMWWHTATLYLFIHGLALLAIAILSQLKWCNARPAYCLMAGIIIFCGSLYGMALGLPTWFGAITPIGGMLFVVGWGWFGGQLLKTLSQPTLS